MIDRIFRRIRGEPAIDRTQTDKTIDVARETRHEMAQETHAFRIEVGEEISRLRRIRGEPTGIPVIDITRGTYDPQAPIYRGRGSHS